MNTQIKSRNKVMMLGHVAATPEQRITVHGKLATSFPLAISRQVEDDRIGMSGEKREVVDFHYCITFDEALGKQIIKNVMKGTAVFIEGEIENRRFEDHEQRTHYRREIKIHCANIVTNDKQYTPNCCDEQAWASC